jgi:hypothetical protein
MLADIKIYLLSVCILLNACSKDTSSQTLDTIGNETSASYNKMRDMAGVSHVKPENKNKPAQNRFCYNTFNDIICYPKPIAGADYRLKGFQDSSGATGYVLPDNYNTPLIPLKSVDVGDAPKVLGTSSLVPAAKPASSQDKKLKEIIFDPKELEPKDLVPAKIE